MRDREKERKTIDVFRELPHLFGSAYPKNQLNLIIQDSDGSKRQSNPSKGQLSLGWINKT
jgi:hypothetical protein